MKENRLGGGGGVFLYRIPTPGNERLFLGEVDFANGKC